MTIPRPHNRRSGKGAQRRLTKHDWLILIIGAVLALTSYKVVSLLMGKKTPLEPTSLVITIPWIPATVNHWQAPIGQMAKKYNIDPNLLAILMTLESGGYAKANSGQAQGLMQITPLTAQDIAKRYLKKPIQSYDLYNPETSIEFGAAYMSYLRRVFGANAQGPSWDGTVELIAAGYNGGPGAANDILKGIGLQDTQTVVYSRDAFNMWRERRAATSPTYNRWLERGGSTLITDAQSH